LGYSKNTGGKFNSIYADKSWIDIPIMSVGFIYILKIYGFLKYELSIV